MEDVCFLLQVAKPHKSKPVKMLDDMIAKDEESEKPVELDMSVSHDVASLVHNGISRTVMYHVVSSLPLSLIAIAFEGP